MSLSSPISERMAARKAYWEYNQYRQLVKAMGATREVSLDEQSVKQELGSSLESWESGSFYPLHPIFLLAEHFMSGDGDSHEKPYVDFRARGDSMIIPAYSEYGQIYFIAIGFHKGETKIRLIRFVDPPAETTQKLLEIIQSYETR